MLITGTFLAVGLGVKTKENAHKLWKGALTQKAASSVVPDKISDSEANSIRMVFKGLAAAHKLPLTVQGTNTEIVISHAGGAEQLLASHQEIYNFLDDISVLPYRMEFKTFCLGIACAGGFYATINLIGT